MRDDFPASVRNELAKRVAFLCSNPGCRQPTSGPQTSAQGAVNIGVAAHISAAAPGGARYDASLSVAERMAASNGIWLCQTCAKLIDSDPARFTTWKVAEWKSDAEQSAQVALEQRRAPASSSDGVFIEAERLMPGLIDEMRTDVRGDATQLVRELVILPNERVVFNSRKGRFHYFESTHPGLRLMVDWLEEMALIVDVTTGNTPIYRFTPEFAKWLRG